jgi:hypothetical protein
MLANLSVAVTLLLPPAFVVGPGASASPMLPAVLVLEPAEAKADPVAYASVKIDGDSLGSDSGAIITRARKQAEQTLTESGVARRFKVDDYVIFIKISPPEDGEDGFVLGIATQRLGQPVLESIQANCPLCLEDELMMKIEQQLQIVATQLNQYVRDAAAREPVDVPEKKPPDQPPPPVTGPEPEQPRTGIGGKGIAGIAALSAGAIAASVGVGLVLREPTQKSETIGYELLDTRPPGYALLGGGAAALITGAILLALDRRGRAPRLGDDAAIAPTFGQSGAGLALFGRF